MTRAEIIEYLYDNNVRADITIEQMADDLADRKTENCSEIPNNCDTCKWGEWYRNGRDITNMDDECGGCCSWNSKWTPKDEPRTEMTTEQIVNELLSIKQILDDGKMPKQRCGNCKHLTYRWNKTWCDIKCDNPHDMVCDKWERSE